MLVLKNQLSKAGGLEKQMLFILKALLKKQKKITLLTTKPKKQNQTPVLPPGITTVFLKNPPLPHFLQLIFFNWQVKKYLKKHPEDKILCFDKSTHQTHLRLGNGLHKFFLRQRKNYEPFFKRLAITFDPRHYTILAFEKKTFQNPLLKKVLVNSEMVFRQIHSLYPSLDPKKIVVVLNGVEWQKMGPAFENSFQSKTLFLKTFGLPENVHHFLFVGHGFKRKGLDLLFKALELLNRQNQKWHLSIVGKDKKIKTYQKIAQKLKLEKQITFFGKQESPLPFYSIADTFVLPSFYDPFANTTLEALAMGLFTITSAFNGGKEVLSESNGIILKSLTKEDLFQALQTALLKPKNKTSAILIRESVKHLEMAVQLEKFIENL